MTVTVSRSTCSMWSAANQRLLSCGTRSPNSNSPIGKANGCRSYSKHYSVSDVRALNADTGHKDSYEKDQIGISR